jgi:hypothetical protein
VTILKISANNLHTRSLMNLIFIFILISIVNCNDDIIDEFHGVGSVVEHEIATSSAHADNHASVGSHLRWLVIGDWGGNANANAAKPYTTSAQWTTARAMAGVARDIDAAFVVSTGDNFYQDGVQSIDDERFEYTFEDVYADARLQRMPWYMVAGNHDHLGNVSAQLAYTHRSSRWRFPSEWYTKRFELRDARRGVVSAQFSFLDGTLFNAQWLHAPFVQVSKQYKQILKQKVIVVLLVGRLMKEKTFHLNVANRHNWLGLKKHWKRRKTSIG